MIGALCALEETTGFDARTSDVAIGTSAGAVLAALLGAGVSPADLRDHQFGVPGAGGPLAGSDFDYSATGGMLPGMPRAAVGSLPLLARWIRSPRSYSPLVALSAVAPVARATLQPVGDVINSFTSGGGWSTHPDLRVVAMDYGTGERAIFSRSAAFGRAPVGLSDAVMASCAVPGWFAPVAIGGRRYVDGAVLSPTHADLAAGLGLDEVYVLAPMASEDPDEPASAAARVERQVRRVMTRRLLREAATLRADGTKAVLLAPGREDLEVMGGNLMDPARRLDVLGTSLRTTSAVLHELTRTALSATGSG
jgi:NTE family protein